MATSIRIGTKIIIKFWLVPLGIGLVGLFLFSARTGLLIVGASIFLALALRPLVNKISGLLNHIFDSKNENKHRTLSAVLSYLLVVLVIGTILAVVGPVVVTETTKFVRNFPETFETTFGGWDGVNSFGQNFGISNLHEQISNAVSGLSDNLLGLLGTNLISSISSVADIVTKIALTIVLTLLFLLEGPAIVETFWKSISSEEEDKKPVAVAKRVVARMANVISTYVSRQVYVAVIDGIAAALFVFLISLFTPVESSLAIPMGMITMLFYLIPMFGQFIGGTLVTLILLFSSPVAAVIFAVVYILYTQIENNLIAPKIQGSALNLPTVAILVSIVIGMYMFGLAGAIIAVPIAGCIRVLVDEYPNIKAARKK